MEKIILKPGREKSLLRRHPWIFSGAVSEVTGKPGMGEVVEILGSHGQILAKAAYSPNSNIIARIWTWDLEEEVSPDLFERRILQAIDIRQQLGDQIPSELSAFGAWRIGWVTGINCRSI